MKPPSASSLLEASLHALWQGLDDDMRAAPTLRASLSWLIMAVLGLHELAGARLLDPASLQKASQQHPARALGALLTRVHEGRAASRLPIAKLQGSLFDPARLGSLFDAASARLRIDDASLSRALSQLATLSASLPSGAQGLGHVRELLLDARVGPDAGPPLRQRRASGAHFTPTALARRILTEALSLRNANTPLSSLRLLDPAAGTGGFVEQAHALLTTLAEQTGERDLDPVTCLRAIERDALSAELTRLVLALRSPSAARDALRRAVVEGDALIGLDAAQLRALSLRPGPDEPLITRLLASGLNPSQRPRLTLAANAVVAATLGELRASEAARLRRRAIATLEGNTDDALFDDVHALLGDRKPLHYPLQFEERGHFRGFDFVVGNPPFGNAIEHATARSTAVSRLYRQAFAGVARGAYDLSVPFVARALSLLREGGVHALVVPRANLSQRSALALQAQVDEIAPLCCVIAPRSARLFARTSVYVVCPIGQKRAQSALDAPRTLRIVSIEGETTEPQARNVTTQPGALWWTLLDAESSTHVDALGSAQLQPLSQVAWAHGGCTTAVAYDLRAWVHDEKEGDGPKLVTTGLIDRHALLWGDREARFLGRLLRYPRWPALAEGLPPAIQRARDRQAGPKVLVAGLSRRLEAWADMHGEAAGSVGVQVLVPREPSLDVRVLAAVVSSWTVSRAYMQRYGGKRMGDGNWTIGKQELLSTPVPSELTSPDFQRAVLSLLDERGRPLDDEMDLRLQRMIARACGLLDGEPIEQLRAWYTGRD